MKKSILLLAVPLLFLTAPTLQAQNKSSIGLNVYVAGTTGLSLKALMSDHVFLMTDINYRMKFTGDISSGLIVYNSYETAINVFYQKQLKETAKADIFWFVGGGFNGGWCSSEKLLKLGVNAISGFEFSLMRAPVSFQLDIRPGYGAFISPTGQSIPELSNGLFSPYKVPFSFFDWDICFSVRYTFNNHQKQTN